MKRIISHIYLLFFALMTGCAPMSCNSLCGDDSAERIKVIISVEERTKAPITEDDRVYNLDLLVFREDGLLEAWNRQSGMEISTDVMRGGSYRWYLIANAPLGLGSFAREADFLKAESRLEDNTLYTYVMEGRGYDVFTAETKVCATLTRIPCKVTLESVTASFLKDSYLSSMVKLERVYLVNACGTIPYSMQRDGKIRYNKTGVETDAGTRLGAMLLRERNIVLTGETIQDNTSLLCYPDEAGETRLVVEISIDGERNYYSIKLPALKSNTEYIVKDLVLLGPGSTSPTEDVIREALSFSVQLTEWMDEDREAIFE